MDLLNQVGVGESLGPLTKDCYIDSVIGNLKRKQQRAQADLDATTKALAALEAHPARS